MHSACCVKNRLAGGLEVRDKTYPFSGSPQYGLQNFLAGTQRFAAKIAAVGVQCIEDEEHEVGGLLLRQRLLQCGEVRDPVTIERHDLAVDQTI